MSRLAAAGLTLGFMISYIAASWLDLFTTDLALMRPGTSEGNVFVAQHGSYDASLAWLVTAVGGVLLTAYFLFGVLNLHRVSDYWLRHPVGSFLSLGSNPFLSLPWLRGVIDRSPLHAVSLALALVLLRLAASANNAMIAAIGDGPLSVAIRWVGAHSTPLVGVATIVGLAYVLLTIGVAKMISRELRQ
jgi:hypothetical protein